MWRDWKDQEVEGQKIFSSPECIKSKGGMNFMEREKKVLQWQNEYIGEHFKGQEKNKTYNA